MGLNITDTIWLAEEKASEDNHEEQMVVLVVLSSLALLVTLYTLVILLFNCWKNKDRVIKLTSPNINIVTCFGCLVALGSIPPLGIEQPITGDIAVISALKRSAVFCLSVGTTIIFSSILVKVWRVHRIFTKMHLSNKGTKDEHLLLIILACTGLDTIINAVWLKVDPVTCAYQLSKNYQGTTGQALLCSSDYWFLWSCLLTSYKLAILLATLFYARQVRHVKLPSLQDSRYIYSNTGIVCSLCISSLPVTLTANVSFTLRFAVQGITVLLCILSTVSLLLLPKVLLIRRKEAQQSAARFLFSESLQKNKERLASPTGCWSCIRQSSQSGSSIGDTVLAQEIETLKQLLKEKDESIRELTDRLFFGEDRFRAYIQEKTTPHISARFPINDYSPRQLDISYPLDNNRTQQYIKSQVGHSETRRSHSKRAYCISPLGQALGQSSTVQWLAPTHCRPKVVYMSSEEETVRSLTPTTDSAINMTPSNSESDHEDYVEYSLPARYRNHRPGPNNHTALNNTETTLEQTHALQEHTVNHKVGDEIEVEVVLSDLSFTSNV